MTINDLILVILSSSVISTIISMLFNWKSEVKIERALKYYNVQFELYNKLWSNLIDLRIIADDLWEKADKNILMRFIKQLKETKNIIEKNSLIIEDEHYKKLMKILKDFENYKIGKSHLIKLKNNTNISNEEIKQLIENNKKLKEEYERLLLIIKNNLKKQLKVG